MLSLTVRARKDRIRRTPTSRSLRTAKLANPATAARRSSRHSELVVAFLDKLQASGRLYFVVMMCHIIWNTTRSTAKSHCPTT